MMAGPMPAGRGYRRNWRCTKSSGVRRSLKEGSASMALSLLPRRMRDSTKRSLWLRFRLLQEATRYFRIVIPFTARLAEETAAGQKPRPNMQSRFTLEAEDHLSLWQLKAGYRYTGATLEQPEHYPGGWADQFVEQGTPLLTHADP